MLRPDEVRTIFRSISRLLVGEGLAEVDEFPLPPSLEGDPLDDPDERALLNYLSSLRSYFAGNSQVTYQSVLGHLNEQLTVEDGQRIRGIDIEFTDEEAEIIGVERIALTGEPPTDLPDTTEAVRLLDEAIAMIEAEFQDG